MNQVTLLPSSTNYIYPHPSTSLGHRAIALYGPMTLVMNGPDIIPADFLNLTLLNQIPLCLTH